jgi:hypothetical protein
VRHSATLGIEIAALNAGCEVDEYGRRVRGGEGVEVAIDGVDVACGVDVGGVVAFGAGLGWGAGVDWWALERRRRRNSDGRRRGEC